MNDRERELEEAAESYVMGRGTGLAKHSESQDEEVQKLRQVEKEAFKKGANWQKEKCKC